MTEPNERDPSSGPITEFQIVLEEDSFTTADLVQAATWTDIFKEQVAAGNIRLPVDLPVTNLGALFAAAVGNPLLPDNVNAGDIDNDDGRSRFPIKNTVDFFAKCYSYIRHLHGLDPTKMHT